MATRRTRYRRVGRSYVVQTTTGIATFVVGYLVVYATATGRIERAMAELQPELLVVPDWAAAGLVYFNAHHVNLFAKWSEATPQVNLVTEGEFLPLYIWLPPLLLVAAGVATTHVKGYLDSRDAFFTGASIMIGYLPLVLVGIVAFWSTPALEASTTGSMTVGVDIFTAIPLAGMGYPFVFGGLGGLLVVAVDSFRS